MASKRVNVSVEEKLKALDRLKAGAKQLHIAKELGVGAATVRGWIANEEKIRKFVQSVDEEEGLQRKRTRMSDEDEIDKALYMWFCDQRGIGTPLSGRIIQAKAKILAKNIKKDPNYEFNASDGWFWRWQKRHGIKQISIQGESRSADNDAAEAYPEELKKILLDGGYADEQVYNADEAALFWKLLPSKTQALRNDPQNEGFKKQKDRFTILFCANKTGLHKLKPLLIGRSKNPRVFNHLNKQNLPLLYESSSNAWMTRDIFHSWFKESFVPAVRLHLRNKGLEEKALLLLDHCPAHPPANELRSRDGKITVAYLPKNTTSKIQPMDQGVIAAFKSNYRRELLLRLLSDDDTPLMEALKLYNLKNMMEIAELSWKQIKSISIENCWLHGLGKAFACEASDVNEIEFTEEQDSGAVAQIVQISELHLDVNADQIKEWINIDNNEPCFQSMTDDEIVARVAMEGEPSVSTPVSDSDEDDPEPPQPLKEAIIAMEKSLRAYEALDSEFVSSMQLFHFRGLIASGRKALIAKTKQMKMEKYFNKQ